MRHELKRSKKRGDKGEWVMRKYHAPWYFIQKSDRVGERQGWDFLFSRDGHSWKVEVKTETMAARTGNLFVEVLSVSTTGALGWAHTSQCDILIIYIWDYGRAQYYRMPRFREQLPDWDARYPRGRAPNIDYYSEGILVPIQAAERHAFAVREVDPYWMKENHVAWVAQ